MKDENKNKKDKKSFITFFSVLGSWCRRMFFGKRKSDFYNSTDADKFESPLKIRVKSFFSRKLAVIALIVLASTFLFVFIAPLAVPMDLNYTDPYQANAEPCYTYRSVPKSLKKDIYDINGFSNFTVGVSSSGKAYVWGSVKDKLWNIDLSKMPKELKNEKVKFISGGTDHIVAITESGKVVAWGKNSNGQYGTTPVLNAVVEPEEIAVNGVDTENVKQLVCGNQATAIVMKDGMVYAWGNKNTVLNIEEISNTDNVEKIAFASSNAVALKKDGSIYTGSTKYYSSTWTKDGNIKTDLETYLSGKKVVDICADSYALAIILENGELIMSGVFENAENKLPTLGNGEYFVKIVSGTRHFVGLTNKNRAFAWGGDFFGQSDINGVKNVEDVYAGSLQTYLLTKKGKVISYGLKGYIMGTDGLGRDVFARIVHGGKTTMTIGAVAVFVSTVIAIIVGCVSGYFGGVVDLVLMRITEIFSAIPFLPFAMLISKVVSYYNISQNMRIFMIMLILGVLSWPGLAQMIRGQVLAEREKEFVVAAKAMGVKESKIAFRHILPNIVSVILVSVTLDFAGCLLTESSLSYLGFGVKLPKPTWGNMLNGANNAIVIQNYWWQWFFPAMFLMIATISINVIGDALRDVVDPKSSLEK